MGARSKYLLGCYQERSCECVTSVIHCSGAPDHQLAVVWQQHVHGTALRLDFIIKLLKHAMKKLHTGEGGRGRTADGVQGEGEEEPTQPQARKRWPNWPLAADCSAASGPMLRGRTSPSASRRPRSMRVHRPPRYRSATCTTASVGCHRCCDTVNGGTAQAPPPFQTPPLTAPGNQQEPSLPSPAALRP